MLFLNHFAHDCSFQQLAQAHNIIFSYRFQKEDMERLHNALQIPAYYVCKQGTKATRVEALMILLRRLTYPNR